jgi:hypothetical protein
MTLTLELAPEIEAALAEEARRQGTTPESLALKTLRERFNAPPEEEEARAEDNDLPDFWKGYVGVVDSRTVNLENIPRHTDPHEIEFGEIMEEKYRRERAKRGC